MIEPSSNPSPVSVALYELIGRVETLNNSTALRFEPAIYQKLLISRTDSQKLIIARIQTLHACSWHTALALYSTSFGACQVMGFNLYGPVLGYDKTVFDFCASDSDQYLIFNSFITKNNIGFLASDLAASHSMRNTFALKYNGSSEYEQNIIAALTHFGYVVTK